MSLPSQRVFVTGATGFIGSRLTHALVEQGMSVHILAREPSVPARRADLADQVTIHKGDLRDRKGLARALDAAQPEIVFHLAAYGTFPCETDLSRMIEVNVQGTANLLASLVGRPCRSIVSTGSVKEYPTGRVPLAEDAPLRPWDAYGATKAAATLLCQLFAERRGLPMTVLRLSPVYGPGDDGERFVPTAILAAFRGDPLAVSVGPLVRNFVYVDDVVAAYLAAALHPTQGEIVNIGGAVASSFDDVVAAVEHVTGQQVPRASTTPPQAPPPDDSWVVDLSKAKRLLDWEPRVSLGEGIRRTVDAMKRMNASVRKVPA